MLGDVTVGLYVSDDIERGWEEAGPYFLNDNASLNGWMQAADAAPVGQRTSFRPDTFTDVPDVEALRANPLYKVLTPEQCLEYVRRTGVLFLNPLCGGLAPDLAWKSLRLIEDRVLPALAAEPDKIAESGSYIPLYLTGRQPVAPSLSAAG
jgi:hypothetical protein